MPNEPAAPGAPPPRLLAAVFGAAGALHLAWPAPFVAMVPPWLPAPGLLVAASGVAALAGAAGVLAPRTRRLAGWGLLLFLVAVFPANVQMARAAAGAPAAARVLLWLRLPFQLVLLAWVWRAAARSPSPPAAGGRGAGA